MLQKAILGTPKTFKVSIGSQSHCTASVEKSLYAPGELVTVTIAYNVGHNNAVVGTSTGTPVKKISDTKYTFLMPNKDVVITASASVMSFKITVNKNDGGSVSVKSVANYGETVTVTLSPAEGYSVGNVSASGVSLSGSGNTRTFSMPAGNVVLNVSFKLEYHVILTIGADTSNRTKHYGYNNGSYGSLSRIPYWTATNTILLTLGDQGRGSLAASYLTMFNYGTAPASLTVNGHVFNKDADLQQSRQYKATSPTNLFWQKDGQKVALTFNPPLLVISDNVNRVFTRSRKEGVVNAWERNATFRKAESREIANSRRVRPRIRTSLLKKWNKGRLLWFRHLGISKRPNYVCYSACSYNNPQYGPGSKDWGLDCGRYIQKCLPRVRQFLLSNKEALYA